MGNGRKGGTERRGKHRHSYHTNEEINYSIEVTYTSNHVGPSRNENKALKAYITVNGHKAKAVFDTGTMRDNLISGNFVSTFQIPTKEHTAPICPKMAIKRSRSTIKYKSQPLMQVGDETSDITDALVCSLYNHDLFLGMPCLTTHNTIIDYTNSILSFPKKGIILIWRRGSKARISIMTNSDTREFISEFPNVFPAKKITELLPLHQINNHLNLSKGKRVPSPKIFTVRDKILRA